VNFSESQPFVSPSDSAKVLMHYRWRLDAPFRGPVCTIEHVSMHHTGHPNAPSVKRLCSMACFFDQNSSCYQRG
ncbi:MAG: hypothetical protein LKH70_07215, partial [Prevotella sp.]